MVASLVTWDRTMRSTTQFVVLGQGQAGPTGHSTVTSVAPLCLLPKVSASNRGQLRGPSGYVLRQGGPQETSSLEETSL